MFGHSSRQSEDSPLYRRLGDAAVVFDPARWETHVLTPVAAVIADIVLELSADRQPTDGEVRAAIQDQLDIDPDQPETKEALRMMEEIGILCR